MKIFLNLDKKEFESQSNEMLIYLNFQPLKQWYRQINVEMSKKESLKIGIFKI